MGSISTLAVIPAMHPQLPYDPIRDFAPVTLVTTSPYIVVVHPSLPAKSMRELAALAKAQPGKIAFASAGTATGIQLAAELFKVAAGIDMTHVPYKGGAPATTALLAAEVPLMFNNVITALPHIKTGRLRALAVTTATRSAIVPDVPTVAESGYPGYEAGTWQGVVTNAGTPQTIVNRLNREIVAILKLPDVREFSREPGQRDQRRHATGVRGIHRRRACEVEQAHQGIGNARAVTGPRRRGALLGLDARSVDDLAPLDDFGLDECREFLRRAADHIRALRA